MAHGNNDDASSRTRSKPSTPSTIGGFATRNAARQAAGHLRSDAVSLEITVRIHGSRVTEVARGVTPRTRSSRRQTSTMIVFPPRRRSAHVHTRERGTDADSHKFENAAGRHLPRRESTRASPRARRVTSKSNSRSPSPDIGAFISPPTGLSLPERFCHRTRRSRPPVRKRRRRKTPFQMLPGRLLQSR